MGVNQILGGAAAPGGKGGSSPPPAPNMSQLISQQQQANLGAFNTQLGAGRVGQSNNYGSTGWTQGPNGTWQQNSSLSQPLQNIVGSAEQNAQGALNAYSPGNNPTWQGPQASQALQQGWTGPGAGQASGMQWQGPNAATATQNLQFNPANVSSALYNQQMGLLEPQMQQQASALDNNLKAMGYDTTQSGGAQNAENNLMNQQNLQRNQAANWAVGQAIPQGAMQLQAQESIPALQANLASQQFGAGQQGLMNAGSLASQMQAGNLGALSTGANIGSQQFGAGLQGQQLLGQQASGFLSNAMSPGAMLPGLTGNAATPGLNPVDIMGAAQQNYANQMSGYNAQQAAQQSQMNGLMSLAGTGAEMAMFMSDRRRKMNIEKLHEVRPGLHAYSFQYKHDKTNQRYVGYMSDEVRELYPDAVTVDSEGYDMVNYSKLPSVV